MELAEPFELELEIVTAKGNRRRARVIGHADLVRGKVFGFFQDITERKGMELKLNQSEDLRARAEALGRVGGWEFDVTTRQLTWTEMVYRLHDLDPAQAPTVEEAINFYAPESRPIIERAVQRAIALGEPFDLDLEIITAKGHRRQVQVIGHADLVRGKVFGFFQDTTERKWAEALRQREARLAAMVNSLVDAVVSADSGGNIVGWNPGAERLFGYQGSDILGQPITLLIPARHHAGHQAGLARVQEGDEYYVNGSSMERHGRRQDGREFPAVLSLSQWSLADEQFYTVIVRDLTEQKQAEDQLRVQSSALAAAANAIVITNRVGKIEWVNPSFTQLTGYSAEEAVGANPRVLKSGQHPPAFYAAMWATISAGNVWHDELVNKRKDGALYTEEMTITPVRGADAQITHFVAIKQDITERRTLENQLRQAQKMEAIGTLAGGIAHDFNNILSAIIGFCHLLELNSSCDQEARGAIEEIHTAANRATEMVKQIVTFSRKGARKREYIRLDGVIKEAMKFLRASLPAQTKIEMDLEADAPIVLADPTQIYQITLNLAANALYAMEGRPGGLTVSVGLFVPDEEFLSAHPDMQPTPYTRLTVSDTGHGMDAMTMGRIFEPFFTNKPVGKGTGLGLSVVHGIVKSHDGIITVESQVGVGTTFCLYFPGQTQPEALPKPRSSAIPQGSAEKVLVVDDETALTKLLQTVLRRLNYDVTITNTPAEAIRWLRETPSRFDLVITDMSMPEINGLELARQLRAIRPCLPVILTSGYSASVDVDTLHEAGICEVLDKPVTIPALAHAVQRSLAKA
jgi:PAS domain S-box-containing protein